MAIDIQGFLILTKYEVAIAISFHEKMQLTYFSQINAKYNYPKQKFTGCQRTLIKHHDRITCTK